MINKEKWRHHKTALAECIFAGTYKYKEERAVHMYRIQAKDIGKI